MFFVPTQFENARDLAKIGKPVDRGEWGETPPTVDAYDNPQLNEIVFPRGHTAATFLRPQARRRVQLWRHRGSHSGTKYAWLRSIRAPNSILAAISRIGTPEDLKSFQERGECVVKTVRWL